MIKKESVMVGVVVNEDETLTYLEVCEQCEISEALLKELIEHGLLPIGLNQLKEQRFNGQAVQRIKSAHRLKNDLELNVAGAVLAMELLEELRLLREEMNILRRHLPIRHED